MLQVEAAGGVIHNALGELTRVAQVFIKRLHFLLEVLNPFSTIWKYVIQGQLKCVPLALAATERSNWTI